MIRILLPVGFFALVIVLGVGLGLNPREVPSPLIGKPVPSFSLSRLRFDDKIVNERELLGKVSLVNFWATWCEGCRIEHPQLVQIANTTGIPIYGVNYKDERAQALQWLDRFGDPYVSSAYDPRGDLGLDFGVYGLPETFVIAADGTIAYKHTRSRRHHCLQTHRTGQRFGLERKIAAGHSFIAGWLDWQIHHREWSTIAVRRAKSQVAR
jgi:cytochrome c biogenesis protein CcmG/thiol:disulfide interchange protein DsbE